jgi:hypothetical protein
MAAVACIICIAMLCATGLKAWAMWLHIQPVCTAIEFERVVTQLNRLTQDMATVQQTADSIRTAAGLAKIGSIRG